MLLSSEWWTSESEPCLLSCGTFPLNYSFHFKDWFSIVKILNVPWESLEWKYSWLICQCTKHFSTFKVIMSHTSLDTGSLFQEISKDAYHLAVFGPRTRKAQPAATGCVAAKVKLLRRDKTATVHHLQADTGHQFRRVHNHISLFFALSLLFFLYPVSSNSKLSSKLLPEILRFTKCISGHIIRLWKMLESP